ncbi:hypothetical protein QWY87_15510 [Lutimonas halocynthiae]|uniref:hypothetical protein n=1 Tax=Lutimonas halocynthiae TaxID=1446477 RepID=UPI0025B2F0D8|nr:hypothetical protein [Lutimonas halocynthiae]MDN3644120.1 hypothetical protein [Lutimonas halocynthiae]
MNTMSLFMSVLALLIAAFIVYYQYFYKQKINNDSKVLSILRFISLFCILLLLINPKFEENYTEVKKPNLFLGADNSKSITYLEREDKVKEFRQSFLNDQELIDKFDLKVFNFGSGITTDTTLSFDENQTDIHKVVDGLNALSSDQPSPIVLITDGNQTFGNNYAYMLSKNPVFPIIIGDTIVHSDLEISRVNVNAYASLDNKFQVELFLNSNVEARIKTKLLVERNGLEMYSSPVSFSKEKKSAYVSFYLAADTVGMQLYKARLIPFEGERNLQNNSYNFGVEILDEQTEVAIVYKVLHPDLGMFKRSIESNKQRKASLIPISEFDATSNDASVVLLYQPDASFESAMKVLEEKELNYLLVTGSHTDWNFLNTVQNKFSKKTSGIIENVFPLFQNEFNLFYTEDLGYENFPPLVTSFGEIEFIAKHEVLLSQRINDVNTGFPLLTAFSENNAKRIVLFGENMWKWRAQSFSDEKSFEKFDLFFNSLMQYLQLSDRNQNMDLFYEPVYNANESIKIQVKNYDSNLNVELNSKLSLQLNDSVAGIPFYIKNNVYELEINNLVAGRYKFAVEELGADKKQYGTFLVVPFSSEQESQSPNRNDLERLARQSKGMEFYEDQFEGIKTELLKNPTFKTVQKERNNLISLIDWKWLLGLIVLSLSLEWLLRKYRGMI